jgi:voltage-gated potassium channel
LRLNQTLKILFSKTLVKVFVVLVVLTLIASAVVLYFEKNAPTHEYGNFWDSVWWALVTVFTVGYGDIKPVTVGGRIVAIVVMLAGISLVSVITATISSIFVARRIREDQGLESTEFENHIIICGWNNRAETLIETIFTIADSKKTRVTLVNELRSEVINTLLDKLRQYKVSYIRGDYTRQAALERANIQRAAAIILLPNTAQVEPQVADEKTLLAALNIKSSYPKRKVLAFILNPENEVHLKRAKADEVFVSDQYSDFMIAGSVIAPGLSNVISDLLNPKGKNFIGLQAIPGKYIGKQYSELFDYFKGQSLLLMGVVAEVESVGISDFLSADSSHLDAFIERKLKEAGKTLGEENRVYVNLKPGDQYIIQANEKAVVLK